MIFPAQLQTVMADRETINTSHWTSPSGSVLVRDLSGFIQVQTNIILEMFCWHSNGFNFNKFSFHRVCPSYYGKSGTSFQWDQLENDKKIVLTKPTTTLTGILREKTIHDVVLDLISNQVSRRAKEPRAKKLKWTFWVLFSPKGNSLWQIETLMQSFRSFRAEITSVHT